MSDPLTFLTAALDAAQRDAEAATQGPWEAHPPLDSGDAWEIRAVVTPGREWRWVVGAEGGGGVYDAPDARHIARHNPQATLRRIAADRKMLAEHLPERVARMPTHETCDDLRCGCYEDVETCGTCAPGHYYDADPAPHPCTTVRLLAEGYGWTETEQR